MTKLVFPKFFKLRLGALEFLGFAGAFIAALLFPIFGYLQHHGITTTPIGDIWFLHVLALLLVLVLWILLKLIQFTYFSVRVTPEKMRLKFLQFAIVALAFVGGIYFSNKCFDAIRLAMNREFYETKLQAYPIAGQDKIEIMIWGESGFAGYSYFTFLARDETGKIANPEKAWGPKWWEKLPRYIKPCGNEGKGWNSKHVFGEFYVIRKAC